MIGLAASPKTAAGFARASCETGVGIRFGCRQVTAVERRPLSMPVAKPARSVDEVSSRAWLVLGLLWIAACSLYVTRNLFVTMHGSIESAIPMTEKQFGLLTSVFLWVYALLGPLGGLLADRFSRSVVIVVSLLAWSSVTWLTAYATTLPELLVLRAMMGVRCGSVMTMGLPRG